MGAFKKALEGGTKQRTPQQIQKAAEQGRKETQKEIRSYQSDRRAELNNIKPSREI